MRLFFEQRCDAAGSPGKAISSFLLRATPYTIPDRIYRPHELVIDYLCHTRHTAEMLSSRLARVIHTVLCCRVILHIRIAAHTHQEPPTTRLDSTIAFRDGETSRSDYQATVPTNQNDTMEMADMSTSTAIVEP